MTIRKITFPVTQSKVYLMVHQVSIRKHIYFNLRIPSHSPLPILSHTRRTKMLSCYYCYYCSGIPILLFFLLPNSLILFSETFKNCNKDSVIQHFYCAATLQKTIQPTGLGHNKNKRTPVSKKRLNISLKNLWPNCGPDFKTNFLLHLERITLPMGKSVLQ